MLGKLARWLRLMGFDTFYANDADDDFLKSLAVKENRLVLTRDAPLHQRIPKGKSLLVRHDRLVPQLKEVCRHFALDRFHLPPRCSHCNGELQPVLKEQIKNCLPPFVARTQSDFSQCRDCGKIFWPGTHLARINLFLMRLDR